MPVCESVSACYLVRGGWGVVCRADGSLADGVKLGVLWYGAECTGAAPPQTAPRPVAVVVALLLSLYVAVVSGATAL